MNKKTIIIGLIITSVVIAGGIYLYQRNKVVTDVDAMEVIDVLNKRDTPFSADNSKLFVDLYVKNIKKDTHAQIKTLLSKKESEWNSQDKRAFRILLDKVLNPLKVK